MTDHRNSHGATYPIDILSASLGNWSTIAEMQFASAAIVTGDRSREALVAAVKRDSGHHALPVELAQGKYQIQLRSISVGAIKRVASIRVLSCKCEHANFGAEIGKTATQGFGELLVFSESTLRAAADLIEAGNDYFDNFCIHQDDCGFVNAEMHGEDSEVDLPFVYLRAGFDSDGTIPVHELVDPTEERVGFQLDFLIIGTECK